MTGFTRALCASFLAIGACVAAPAFAADAAAEVAAEVAALQAVDQTWLKAYNAGDADTAASLYDEHAVLLPPGAPAAKGRSALRSFLASDMAASKKAGVAFHLDANPDGGVNGDFGWVSGSYSVTDASGNVVERGKYLSVSKKSGGAWRYVRDTWNSDGSPAPAAPATP